MKIETFWDDIDLYVVLYRNYDNEVVMLDTILIVPTQTEENDIIKKLKLKFKEIKEVTQIDHFSEGLFLKKG
ncbi:hypothetical protein [Carnobacterium maltaromaticum]|uniref:hypothetical protein n=1 Tax=Carnobacterium maltaromaticum TaxID=2751 RepID=UPI00295EBD4D|nr:hypothetical protein [Carnobacterium maltaromaticum]